MKNVIQTGMLIATLFLIIAVPQLSGQQLTEVILGGYNLPHPVATPATGIMTVTLVSDSLVVSGHFSDLRGNYMTAGIYYGQTEERGNRIFRLVADMDEDWKGGSFQAEKNRFALPSAIKEALRGGRLYINVSTRRYQQGEIRGQIPAMH